MRSGLYVLMLAGCAVAPAVDRPAEGTPVIAASGFSGLYGGSFLTIWQGDVVELRVRDFSDGTDSQDRAVIPGAFAAATDALVRLGPAAADIAPTTPGDCTDYGEDVVVANPPVAGFDRVVTACPDDDLGALRRALFAISAPLGE